MKTIRALTLVCGCLLAVLATGHWWGHRVPLAAATPGKAAAPAVPVAGIAQTPVPRELRDVRPEPSVPKPERLQVKGDSAMPSGMMNSNSPVNTQDLDQNREWARNYPGEALAWLAKAPDSEQRIAIAEIAFPQVAQTNGAAAVALAENSLGNSTNPIAPHLLESLVQQWAVQDIQMAADWVLASPEGEQRDRLLQRIAMVESQTNPGNAARLIAEQMSPGSSQDEAAISVLYQWAQQDSKAALAWAEAFPPGGLRERAINEVKNVSTYALAAPRGN